MTCDSENASPARSLGTASRQLYNCNLLRSFRFDLLLDDQTALDVRRPRCWTVKCRAQHHQHRCTRSYATITPAPTAANSQVATPRHCLRRHALDWSCRHDP